MSDERVFHTLDLLRGIAAIGVVTFHMKALFTPITAVSGYLAVDLFFIMSGVVISHAYEHRFRSGMGVIEFMRVRLIRLYPLYFLGTIFGIAVTVASLYGRNIQHWDITSLSLASLLAFLFLPNFSGRPTDQIFPLNIPCWSLFFEVFVNLIFALFWPILTSTRLALTCLLSGLVVGAVAIYSGHLDLGSATADFAIGLIRTTFGFSAGVLIARRTSQMRRRTSNATVLAIVFAACAAIAGQPQGAARIAWDITCVLLVFPALVYAGVLFDPDRLLRRCATFVGVISYAIYVLHSPLSSVINSSARVFTEKFGQIISAPYLGVVVIVILMFGCWLVATVYDAPARRALSQSVPIKRSKSNTPQ